MKVFLIVLTILCWIGAILLLGALGVMIGSFENLDPWGLTFTFFMLPVFILPIGIVEMLFLSGAIVLTVILIKERMKNKR